MRTPRHRGTVLLGGGGEWDSRPFARPVLPSGPHKWAKEAPNPPSPTDQHEGKHLETCLLWHLGTGVLEPHNRGGSEVATQPLLPPGHRIGEDQKWIRSPYRLRGLQSQSGSNQKWLGYIKPIQPCPPQTHRHTLGTTVPLFFWGGVPS